MCELVVENSEEKRLPVNLALQPEAANIINGLRKDTGIPVTVAMTTLLEWFASLDRKFRLAILLKDEAARQELSLLVLQQMAGMSGAELEEASGKFDVSTAARTIRALLDRIETAAISREAALEAKLKEGSKGKKG